MSLSLNLILFFFVFFLCCPKIETIYCVVGYGQRGLAYSNSVRWTRNCPYTKYCFEAVTTDVEKVRKLIDFPWDKYYYEFYIKSCGGDFGMPLEYHPYRGNPKFYRNPKYVKVNLTTPFEINGQGGTEQFDLNYICR
jgi:hypothetical protein